MSKVKSPYSAITGCAFLYYEFMRILPLLMDKDSERLIREEIVDNNLMMVNSYVSRKRFMTEFKRRFNALPLAFWEEFFTLSEAGQRMGILYSLLKGYKLIFDLHFNLTLKRWNSVSQTLTKSDVIMGLNILSSKDEFVDSWTDQTKERSASQYITILRQAWMLEEMGDKLKPLLLDASQYAYYIRTGEEWFLEACLLYPYEIEQLKSELL